MMHHQPQGKPQLHASALNARIFVVPNGTGLVDLVSGQLAQYESCEPIPVVSPIGLGIRTTNVAKPTTGTSPGAYFELPNLLPVGGDKLTIFALLKLDPTPGSIPNQDTNTECVILRNEANDSAGQFGFAYFPISHKVRLLINTSGTSGWRVNDIILQCPLDAMLCIHATWVSGRPIAITYRDLRGGHTWTASPPVTPTGTTSRNNNPRTYVSGGMNINNRALPAELYFAGMWLEYHPLVKSIEMLKNPWGVFAAPDDEPELDIIREIQAQIRKALYLNGQGYIMESPTLPAKPLVLYQGQIQERSAGEGTPLILDQGQLRTLASTETLQT